MLSLQLQDVDGFSPLAAGLAFLPLGVLVGTVAVIAPRLAAYIGLKPVLITLASELSRASPGPERLRASGYAYSFLAAAVGLIATALTALTMPGRTSAADRQQIPKNTRVQTSRRERS